MNPNFIIFIKIILWIIVPIFYTALCSYLGIQIARYKISKDIYDLANNELNESKDAIRDIFINIAASLKDNNKGEK